jgi:hypothetical protein
MSLWNWPWSTSRGDKKGGARWGLIVNGITSKPMVVPPRLWDEIGRHAEKALGEPVSSRSQPRVRDSETERLRVVDGRARGAPRGSDQLATGQR